MTMDVNKKRIIKEYVKRLLIVCLIQVFLFSAPFASIGYATNTQQVEFPIKQVIVTESATTPQDVIFTYQLVPKTSGAPMPQGSVDDNGNGRSYTFTINGEEESLIGPLAFENSGIFIYEVSCTTESKADFAIDKRIYTIEVHTMVSMEIYVIIHNSNGDKVEKIIFEHISGSDKTNDGGSDNNDGSDSFDNTGKTNTKEEHSKTDNIDELENNTNSPKESDALDEEGEFTEADMSNKSGSNPKTGAAGNQMLWLILMFLSGVLLIILPLKRRKSNKDAARLS